VASGGANFPAGWREIACEINVAHPPPPTPPPGSIGVLNHPPKNKTKRLGPRQSLELEPRQRLEWQSALDAAGEPLVNRDF